MESSNGMPPAGDWIVYRFGHTTMGTLIQPAQWKATGFECDKMSAEAVTAHMNHVIGETKRHLGKLVGDGFTFVHLDSYEAGKPSWTPKMREEFSARRGYDMTPYLATFAKRTIGSSQETAKFKAERWGSFTCKYVIARQDYPGIDRLLEKVS